jgi:hypothetical protein
MNTLRACSSAATAVKVAIPVGGLCQGLSRGLSAEPLPGSPTQRVLALSCNFHRMHSGTLLVVMLASCLLHPQGLIAVTA